MKRTIHLELQVDSPEAVEALKTLIESSKKQNLPTKKLSLNDQLLAINLKLEMILNHLNLKDIGSMTIDQIWAEGRRRGLNADEITELVNQAGEARAKLTSG